jgi:ABC-2 type transport system permease protein
MTFRREYVAAVRLDLGEVLRSRWLLFCGAVYGVMAAALILVGLRESAIMGFAGVGRVLLSFCHGLIFVLPLLALTATGHVINRARDDGMLELLFSQPIRRSSYFLGVTTVRFAILVVPLLAFVLGMALWARLTQGQEIPWPFVWRAVALCASLLACFVGLGLAISVFVRNQAKAAVVVLLVWAAGVALLDFGLLALMLEWQLNPRAVFLLAALNPVGSARLGLLSGIEPDLETLGPVGFYLANRLGPDLLYLIGVAWPAILGGGAWLAALLRFRRGDLV